MRLSSEASVAARCMVNVRDGPKCLTGSELAALQCCMDDDIVKPTGAINKMLVL